MKNNLLTSQSHFGYDTFVPAKSGAGSEHPMESRRTTTACESRAVFLCPQHGVLYSNYGLAMWGDNRASLSITYSYIVNIRTIMRAIIF